MNNKPDKRLFFTNNNEANRGLRQNVQIRQKNSFIFIHLLRAGPNVIKLFTTVVYQFSF
jgi:hypothetical protein